MRFELLDIVEIKKKWIFGKESIHYLGKIDILKLDDKSEDRMNNVNSDFIQEQSLKYTYNDISIDVKTEFYYSHPLEKLLHKNKSNNPEFYNKTLYIVIHIQNTSTRTLNVQVIGFKIDKKGNIKIKSNSKYIELHKLLL